MLKYSANITYRIEEDAEVDLKYPELGIENTEYYYDITGDKGQDRELIIELIQSELDRMILTRKLIPISENATGEFVFNVDKSAETRIRLSNWFIEQTTYEDLEQIRKAYIELSLGEEEYKKYCTERNYDTSRLLGLAEFENIFDLYEEFNKEHVDEVIRTFNIPADYLEPMDAWTKEIMTHPAEC